MRWGRSLAERVIDAKTSSQSTGGHIFQMLARMREHSRLVVEVQRDANTNGRYGRTVVAQIENSMPLYFW